MADESLHVPSAEQNIDFHIITLFERLETIRKDRSLMQTIGARLSSSSAQGKRSMQAEIRTLEFWRSIISECVASFFYVFIVCGAAAGAGVGASVSSVLLATSLASGFAVATLTQCFMHVSGAHINPAVTFASCIIRALSPLRAAMYITAQCGGGIAGAALLYGVTVPGYQGNLQAAISHSATLAPWERFGVEFILTFIVVLSYFVSTDSFKKYLGNTPLTIGAAYSACSFVSMPYLNPARSLGPSFVLNKWDNHWVYWCGPLVGGVVSGIVYEYVFNSKRHLRKSKDHLDNDSLSIHSEEEINCDLELEKPNMQNPKFQGSTYRSPANTLGQHGGYCQNLYTTAPLTKLDQGEPLYGGTRSLYCRSPPLTRGNLNRSQSVYAKSNTAINRDLLPRPGPLVPAQSLYPIRATQTQSSHLQNQNVQNQLQQRSGSLYGIRGSTRQNQSVQMQQHQQHQTQQQQPPQERPTQDVSAFQPIYGTRHNPAPNDGMKYDVREESSKYMRPNRPESMYGTNGHRAQAPSAQSDDSSYSSYHGSAILPATRNPAIDNMIYQSQQSNQIRGGSQPERKMSSSGTNNSANVVQTYATKPPQPMSGSNQGSMVNHQYGGIMPIRQN